MSDPYENRKPSSLVIPVSEPTKAGGFDGIHFRLSPR